MSFKHRLNKLEQRNAEFVISWAIYLDGDGNQIPWRSNIGEDAAAAVRFMTGTDGGYVVERLKDEPYEDLKDRAHQDAAEELNVTLFAPPGLISGEVN